MEISDCSMSSGRARDGDASPMLAPEYWEAVFAEEDPWRYGDSAYETWKFGETLSLLPAGRIGRALELGCAEGHLTSRLAPRVEHLVAADISPTAIGRARTRCAALANVECRTLNIARDPLPVDFDLILCSEVLFYLPLATLGEVAPRIVASLRPGGHLLLAHGNLIGDDRTRTGFDWGHPFGAKTIGKVFAALDGLALTRELRTPLFTVQLFRRALDGAAERGAPEIRDIPLPPDLVLNPEVERTILWDGAVTTRAEAAASERASQVPILMYHSVADDGPPELAPYRVSLAAFREQLRYLRRHGFHSVSLEEWAAAIAERRPLEGRPVILTFDDGYKDFAQNALPLLERSDFSATLFVVTDRVGRAADWEENASAPMRLMSWKELRDLQARGIEIGSHSAAHRDLSTLPPQEVVAEGERARRALSGKLGVDARAIALPWGRGDAEVRRLLAGCGYTTCLTTWGGHSTLTDDPLHLPRIEISGEDDLAAFAQKLKPANAPQTNAKAATGELEVVGFEAPAATAEPESPAAAAPVGRAAGLARSRLGFAARAAAEFPDAERSGNPDYLRSLAARLDQLIGEFVMLQTQLLNELSPAVTLQKRLTRLFVQPVTGKVSRVLAPRAEVCAGIAVTFDPAAEVSE